jgi:polysaccharide deacetylase 2 family uncharacterized protein YibQ
MRDALLGIICGLLIFALANAVFQQNDGRHLSPFQAASKKLPFTGVSPTKEEIAERAIEKLIEENIPLVTEPPVLSEKKLMPPELPAPVAAEPEPPEAPWTGDRAKIAIIIDDVGLDYKRSLRSAKLPAGVTLAYLPYAPHVQDQVNKAQAQGHQIMVHLPMQPERATVDPGPNYLGVDLPPEEVARRVEVNLSAFTGYVAVNNHMGSQFTQDGERLKILMAALRKRGVMFIDSKTAPQSIAEKTAREFGIKAESRDIFIDHVEDRAHVKAALIKIEQIARKRGKVIAIGHPKDVTLDALEYWIPGLKKRGFDLVPVTDVVR